MNARRFILILTLFALRLPVTAGELPISIEDAWVRAVPPGSRATAAYMTIVNPGSEPLKLTGGRTAIAKMVRPMITVWKTVDGKEVSGMELVESLEIPAGGRAILKPGGDHLMIMEMTEQPSPGDTVRLTLRFEPGSHDLALELPVSRSAPEPRK